MALHYMEKNKTMSTSDLYHTFRILKNSIHKYLLFGQKTVIHCSFSQKQRKCPDCKSRKVIKFGQIECTFKMVPVGNCKVDLVVKIGRIQCKDCGAIKQPRLSFADPKKYYTRALERYTIDLCRLMTIQNVAALTGLS
jgi:transposase